MPSPNNIELSFANTRQHCPIGETVGKEHMAKGDTPVLSCEGACIRGEIARQAANIVARQPGCGRGCHGELLTVPESAIAQWFHTAERVVLIDGCFLRCHGRILENLLPTGKLIQFDALSHYKKYTDVFDPEDVPFDERQAVARDVAACVADQLADGHAASSEKPCAQSSQACCG